MSAYALPRYTHVDLTDAECEAVKAFWTFGATAGPDRRAPAALMAHMDAMAAVCGRITIAREEQHPT